MRVGRLEEASPFITRSLVAPGIGLAFVFFALMFAMLFMERPPISFVVVAAAGIGAYMALNIGANDVANNMGPAVGSGALRMGAALAIAAVCETAGALLAGGDVVNTISSGIIDPASVAEPRVFVWAMMATLIASAL